MGGSCQGNLGCAASTGQDKGTVIKVKQNNGGITGIFGSMTYEANSQQIFLQIGSWNGGYSLSNGHQGTPTDFDRFIDCPIGKTAEEWYTLIAKEEIEKKGRLVKETEDPDIGFISKLWNFQTEWGEGCYYEDENAVNGRHWCALAIDCSGQEGKSVIFSVQLIIEPDGGIDMIVSIFLSSRRKRTNGWKR